MRDFLIRLRNALVEPTARLIRFLTKPAMFRNYWRVLMGFVMGSGLLSQEAADFFNTNEDLLRNLELGLSWLGLIGVEALYAYAKRNGWST